MCGSRFGNLATVSLFDEQKTAKLRRAISFRNLQIEEKTFPIEKRTRECTQTGCVKSR
jgi:hypothetical protein